MSLAQMSVSGAVMISVTVVFRALLLHRLPKRTFLILWFIVTLRLLIPYSLPCAFSAYSLSVQSGAAEEAAGNIAMPFMPDFSSGDTVKAPDVPDTPAAAPTVDLRTAVWLTGVLAGALFFTAAYIKCRMRFSQSLPVDNEFVDRWLDEHRLCRRISVRQSDRISSPLTYGIFRPAILLPKNFERIGADDLKFVLAHEYVHIRRFDLVFKLMLTAALCVHWFDPMVWVMYVIANRDIEISCDEAVIRMFGDREKSAYAMALIRMEEKKSGLAPLNNYFSKNAIKERIVTIMKLKKTTVLTIIAAACLVIGTTTAFATTAQQRSSEPVRQTSRPDEAIPESSPTDEPENSVTEPVMSTAADPVSDPETPAAEVSDETDNVSSADDKAELPNEDDIIVIGSETPRDDSFLMMICADGIKRYFPRPDDHQTKYMVETYVDENNNVVARYTPIKDNGETESYTHEEAVEGGYIRW